ncbi:MAG: hypothetical protein IJ214_08570 [Clostridia bacterium]|nr:hypothetical protein [Clostridia bacterium]
MKTILLTGIGGLTPRSIASIIREKHPDYKIVGCDIEKKAVGFYIKGLVDACYVVPRCGSDAYFPCIERLVKKEHVDYAFVQPESEIIAWGDYYEKNGRYPCPVFMTDKRLSASLRNKSMMAELLAGTEFIPRTIKVTQDQPAYAEVEKIGFPCWIRAAEGTGGRGSLRLDGMNSFKSWLFINGNIPEFTVSEFLPGRHLANQMLYYNGEYVKGAALECVEYVMANTAPSHVTGNTHFGRFLNEDRINEFCDRCVKYLEKKLGVSAHGVLSFDLKEDGQGNLKVTEINIRHMAYTGVMARAGFDLIEDTIKILEDGNCGGVERDLYHQYDKPYVFLRDVDIQPIILESEEVFNRHGKI